ncbi:PilN domain-containing protein [Salipaludibacillus aurantiacus]|uniref:Tfp pilus assembly protein PilN n=1 Tax=Salipaludibacillus aurantiacus TaxID=1601833 RepID=A0A1H9T706_9BACI|nr:hypothetical protein [Salipaludibacillus aurantiacus]SER92363.1 hypothetical protein SAMN05518684_105129 [Salipaludibacillus aurantiacus]
MSVEINLLPEKRARKGLFYIYGSAALLLLVVLLFTLAISYQQNLLKEQERLTVQADEVREQQEAERSKVAGTDAEAEQLESVIEKLEAQRNPTTSLLNILVGNLPERGFFLEFQFENPGHINLDAQFETQRGASSYLHEINQLPAVEEATIEEIKGEELLPDDGTFTGDEMPRYHVSFSIRLYEHIFNDYENWIEAMGSYEEQLESERSLQDQGEFGEFEQEADPETEFDTESGSDVDTDTGNDDDGDLGTEFNSETEFNSDNGFDLENELNDSDDLNEEEESLFNDDDVFNDDETGEDD